MRSAREEMERASTLVVTRRIGLARPSGDDALALPQRSGAFLGLR
jgi:hypothetical protein